MAGVRGTPDPIPSPPPPWPSQPQRSEGPDDPNYASLVTRLALAQAGRQNKRARRAPEPHRAPVTPNVRLHLVVAYARHTCKILDNHPAALQTWVDVRPDRAPSSSTIESEEAGEGGLPPIAARLGATGTKTETRPMNRSSCSSPERVLELEDHASCSRLERRSRDSHARHDPAKKA